MSGQRSLLRLLFAAALLVETSAALSVDRVKMFTGPERGIQPKIGREFSKFVGRAAGIEIEIVPTAGAADSMLRLDGEPGFSLALLQSDTAYAYREVAARGNLDAVQIMTPARLIAPLYQEFFYFVVRSDSPLDAVDDIKDARINAGPLKSGTAVAVSSLYSLMFDAALPDDKLSNLGHEEALVRLITDQTVDVVAMVGEQPAKLLSDMKPEARRFVKLLKFDPSRAGGAAALRAYDAALVRANSYPNLLHEDLPALALRIYLVAYAHQRGAYDEEVRRLTRAWCETLPHLKAEGHPIWREVEAAAGEPKPGWTYAKPALAELQRCAGGSATELPAQACSQQERMLGFCQ